MSLFGGSRGKRNSERTAEDRRRAMEERQRRRDAAGQRHQSRPPGESVAPPPPRPRVPAQPVPQTVAPEPAPPSEPIAVAQAGTLPVTAEPRQPAQAEPPQSAPREPSKRAKAKAARKTKAQRRAEKLQARAPAEPQPDRREIAVHRRRGAGVRRTVVGSPDEVGVVKPPSRRRRWVRTIALLAGALLLVSQWMLWQPFKGGGGEPVTVKIPEGAGASEVAQRIADAGVVDSASLFSLRAVLAGKRNSLSAGTLKLRENMSYGAALAALSGAVPATPDLQRVTIPEGLAISEVDARLAHRNVVPGYQKAAGRLLAAEKAALRSEFGMPKATRTIEGLLFPSTYEVLDGFKADDLVTLQLDALRQTMATVDLKKAKKAKLSAYKVLIIASMVEREARLTRERPLISAVIHNRLKVGMPLGIDATFRYASGNWTDPIKQSELDADGPYNSRLRQGLPPTPIGNPGRDSILAAANPADVDFLYFVVKPGRCGEHAFSSTAEKFADDLAKYREAREAAGASPVTC